MIFKIEREIIMPKWIMGSLTCLGDPDFRLATLENPWQDNEPYISCIPNGRYDCERVESPRFGNTFEIKNVEGRTHILFHWGNYEKDTLGCVLLGMVQIPENNMIGKSRKGFGEFIKYTAGVDNFVLDIVSQSNRGAPE